MSKKYWLMKSEPDVFSIEDLKRKDKSLWDGVRNYQARNFMTQEMRVGDLVLFYHSSATPPGVAGLAKISSQAQPDPSQFDKKSEYYDEKATKENPRWFCVEVQFVEAFKELFSLDEMREDKQLKDMLVLKRGQRLSIQPVSSKDFSHICKKRGYKL